MIRSHPFEEQHQYEEWAEYVWAELEIEELSWQRETRLHFLVDDANQLAVVEIIEYWEPE